MEEGLVLPTLVIRPGKELVIFKIGIEKDRLGLLAQVSSEFTNRGMRIYSTVAQVSPEGKEVIFISSEAKGSDVLEELRISLESIEGVGRVEIETSSTKGLLIPSLFFPLTRAGRRIVLMVDVALKSLIEELARIMGRDPADAVIFRVGYELGMGFGRSHLAIGERVGLRDPLEIIKHISAPLFISSGYGLMRIEELPERTLRIVVEEGIEASLRGVSERPSCFFTKGMCKGALEAIFGEKISIEEVNCRTIGHDFCEFIVNY
ncbi:MAG: V4R domain-containing protein [Candidatus Korarchaeum sp.]